jgi:hypothetical protein
MSYYFKNWLISLKHYVLMCLFQSGPDRLPGGLHSILISAFCYFLIGLSLVDEQHSYATIVLLILLELALLALIIYTGLKWKKMISRLTQSFSALLGVNMVISAISVPVNQALTEDFANDGEISRTVVNVTLLIVFWNLSVMSLVLKRALNINTLLAAMISFNYFMVYQFLNFWLF